MNVGLLCYYLERDWGDHLPKPTWEMNRTDHIPTALGFQEQNQFEQLYNITYHLNGLGGGSGVVHLLQQSPGAVFMRIHELTTLDRLFFAPSMAKWLMHTFGVVVDVDWANTNAPELQLLASEAPAALASTPAAQLEDRKPRQRGRRRLNCNEWARAEYAKGRTVDDLLTEYADMYKRETGNDLADPRESIKQALK